MLSGAESYGSIGYAAYGVKGEFLINGFITFLCLGMTVAYFIIFADAADPLIEEFLDIKDARKWSIFLLALLILPVSLKKKVG